MNAAQRKVMEKVFVAAMQIRGDGIKGRELRYDVNGMPDAVANSSLVVMFRKGYVKIETDKQIRDNTWYNVVETREGLIAARKFDDEK